MIAREEQRTFLDIGKAWLSCFRPQDGDSCDQLVVIYVDWANARLIRFPLSVFLGIDAHLLEINAHDVSQFLDCGHYVANCFRAGKKRA